MIQYFKFALLPTHAFEFLAISHLEHSFTNSEGRNEITYDYD